MQQTCIIHLPNEVLSTVISQLPNKDLKSLRLSCAFFRYMAQPRINRVFVSASKRDIEVIRAIAADEYYRKQVTEIIWDDTRLTTKTLSPNNMSAGDGWGITIDSVDGVPGWFARAQELSAFYMKARATGDYDHPGVIAREKQLEFQMPLRESWEYYKELVRQQYEVLATGADAEAFMHALERFPSLKRVTVTPVAHGFLFLPLYETPMIRSFPYGFNYPVPRGWGIGYPDSTNTPPRWDDGTEGMKELWRGFRIVTRALAQEKTQHRVTELIFPVFHTRTGLNCHILDQKTEEYLYLDNILHRPGFKRLDLSIVVGSFNSHDVTSFRNGHLRQALANVNALNHFSLTTNIRDMSRSEEDPMGGPIELHVPLHTIFPVQDWPHLRHFGLSGFLITQADLISFLAALPPTLRSVELSHLYFLDDGDCGCYLALLEEIRNGLDWRHRPADERPQITIALNGHAEGMAVWVKDEVQEYIYGNGPNPFDDRCPNQLVMGKEKDDFNPHYPQPYRVQPYRAQPYRAYSHRTHPSRAQPYRL